MSNRAIVFFHRLEINGNNTKTRIANSYGGTALASELSFELLLYMLDNLYTFDGDVYVCAPSDCQYPSTNILIRDKKVTILAGDTDSRGDVLCRVKDSISILQGMGYEKIISSVADAPNMKKEYYELIFDMLNHNNVVLAPAFDRGINAYAVNAGVDLEWLNAKRTNSRVEDFDLIGELTQNLERLQIHHSTVDVILGDIDEYDDVLKFYNELRNTDRSEYADRLFNFIKDNYDLQ